MEDNILYFVYKNKISQQSFLNFEFFLFKKVYVPMYLYLFFCIYYAFYGIYLFNFLIRAQNFYVTETKKTK